MNPDSETETFIALKCAIDNWRWAGVPFFLRTGKRLAEGQRIISIAFREPPKSMFPAGSGVGEQGPDHLTFDLADASKMSLSFYGKRPGPGMRLDKLSLQFAMRDTGLDRRRARGVRAPDPRCDARRSHAVHHGRRHRATVGGVDAAARSHRRRCAPMRRARGDRTRFISSSRRARGGCRSSAAGATRIAKAVEPGKNRGRRRSGWLQDATSTAPLLHNPRSPAKTAMSSSPAADGRHLSLSRDSTKFVSESDTGFEDVWRGESA